MLYSGKFGFAETVETAPGVWDDVITERPYIGQVVQRTELVGLESDVLPTYRTSTSFSVFSDGVLKESYANLRYVEWAGEKWTVASVVLLWPRLVVYIGEVYNGPTPDPAP